MIVDEIIKYIDSKSMFKTPKEIVENALWFYIACKVGIFRQEIEIDGKVLPLNYYAITVAQSGIGKDYSYSEIDKLFNVDYEQIRDYLIGKFDEVNELPIEIGNGLELKDFIPHADTCSIKGSIQGLYTVAEAISANSVGSLNILNNEIMDIIEGSNIEALKEMFDGTMQGELIKSKVNKNLDGLHVNCLLFGSGIGIKKDKKIYSYFNRALTSGMYRRSFVLYVEAKKIERSKVIKADTPNIEPFKLWLNETRSKHIEPLGMSDEALEYCETIKDELLEFANDNLDDDRYSAELGSFQKIVKLAGLHSILHYKGIIDKEDLDYSYDFYLRCRATVGSLFNTIPQHVMFYKIIKRCSNVTKSEIFEKDIFNQSNYKEDILMAKELAYRNNEILIESGSNIIKYKIEPLPKTKLDKIIVSVPADGMDKKEKTTNYIPLEIPFFGDGKSMEKLVVSDSISNFTLCHFKSNGNSTIRNSSNYIDNCNCLAFDIDGNLSLEDAKEMFKHFTCIIYTTRSHQIEKRGITCDRFRIIIPTKTSFSVSENQHKKLYENISESLGLNIADVSCFNAGRLFFTQDPS